MYELRKSKIIRTATKEFRKDIQLHSDGSLKLCFLNFLMAAGFLYKACKAKRTILSERAFQFVRSCSISSIGGTTCSPISRTTWSVTQYLPALRYLQHLTFISAPRQSSTSQHLFNVYILQPMSNNDIRPAGRSPIGVVSVIFGETAAVGPPLLVRYSDDAVLLGESECVHSEITTPIFE